MLISVLKHSLIILLSRFLSGKNRIRFFHKFFFRFKSLCLFDLYSITQHSENIYQSIKKIAKNNLKKKSMIENCSNKPKKNLKLSYINPSLWWKRSLKINSKEWRELRIKILQRDNYQCYFCAVRANKYMIVDHISGDATDNNLENLRVLCPMCDTIRHSGLAGIEGTLQVLKSKISQLEIVEKTREFYLTKKKWPKPQEIDPDCKETKFIPIEVATEEGEEVPFKLSGYKGFFTKNFAKKFSAQFLNYLL